MWDIPSILCLFSRSHVASVVESFGQSCQSQTCHSPVVLITEVFMLCVDCAKQKYEEKSGGL